MEFTYEVREAPCAHCGSELYVVVRVCGDSVVEMGRRVADEDAAAAYKEKLEASDEKVRHRRATARTVVESQSAMAVKLPYIPPDAP